MEQNDVKTNIEKEDLEKKIGFWDRTKYMALPAVATIGAGFVPEIKKKYTNISPEKKEAYRSVTLAGTTILGTVLAIASAYNLFKDKNKEAAR
jgi:hypothetical protein